MKPAEQAKATPGPWRFDEDAPPLKRDGGQGLPYLSIYGTETGDIEWEIAQVNGTGRAQSRANARLIAEAPKLYAALKSVVIQMRTEHDRGGGLFSTAEVEAAELAIARVEGRS